MSHYGDYRYWGSDCTACGNTTPGSMVCDECGDDGNTVPLFAKSEHTSPTAVCWENINGPATPTTTSGARPEPYGGSDMVHSTAPVKPRRQQ